MKRAFFWVVLYSLIKFTGVSEVLPAFITRVMYDHSSDGGGSKHL
jgi:hypothetical protein